MTTGVPHSYCTYCSKDKRNDTSPLPAIDRYQSLRIAHVYERAQGEGLNFVILSGQFGILTPDEAIPYYDHLLLAEEVSAMSERVQGQLKELKFQRLTHFTASPEEQPAVQAYLAVMQNACLALEIDFSIEILDAPYTD